MGVCSIISSEGGSIHEHVVKMKSGVLLLPIRNNDGGGRGGSSTIFCGRCAVVVCIIVCGIVGGSSVGGCYGTIG